MSIQILTDNPMEEGTIVFTIVPTDEDGETISFSDLGNPQWQMSTLDGSVIPGCSYSDSSMSALDFVVKGPQLSILNSDDTGVRVLTFTATYDSSAGSNLPLHAECKFKIQSLIGV